MTDDAKLKAFQIRRELRWDAEQQNFFVVGEDRIVPYDIATVTAGARQQKVDEKIEEDQQRAIQRHADRFFEKMGRLYTRGRLLQMKSLRHRRPLPARTTER